MKLTPRVIKERLKKQFLLTSVIPEEYQAETTSPNCYTYEEALDIGLLEALKLIE